MNRLCYACVAVCLVGVFAVPEAQTTEAIGDTLRQSVQVTVPARVQRPSFRWVSGNAKVGDSIRVEIYTNGVLRKRYRYTQTQAPLDTANVTRAVVTGYIDDFSK